MNIPAFLALFFALLSPPSAAADASWFENAQALERSRDWRGLLLLGQQWTRAETDNALAWFVLGRALGKLGQYPEAIVAYRRNLLLDPQDIHAHNNLGNLFRATRRYREAMDAYHAAVRSSPDYIPAWHNLGLTFYDLKGAAGVTEALLRLQATHPGLAEAWRRLAVEYSLSRDARAAQGAILILRRLSDAERERMFTILLGQP